MSVYDDCVLPEGTASESCLSLASLDPGGVEHDRPAEESDNYCHGEEHGCSQKHLFDSSVDFLSD